jgi:hypothetical protein
MNFRVGQKVVCVDDAPTRRPGRFTGGNHGLLTKGEVYTIREIDCRAIHLHNSATVRLTEITLPVKNTWVGLWEEGFSPYRFRPAVERKTDISIFTKILDGPLHDRPRVIQRS